MLHIWLGSGVVERIIAVFVENLPWGAAEFVKICRRQLWSLVIGLAL